MILEPQVSPHCWKPRSHFQGCQKKMPKCSTTHVDSESPITRHSDSDPSSAPVATVNAMNTIE